MLRFEQKYEEWMQAHLSEDSNHRRRDLDLAYMPGGAKGGIEIQGYGPHARDLDVRRFKDLCRAALFVSSRWVVFLTHSLSIY